MKSKTRFSYADRYAVWHCNERRCWWCKEPLRLVEVTIDHVLPESLLIDDTLREAVFTNITEYGLPKHFNINGYANWLPCHNHCNQKKPTRVPTFVPGNKAVLDGLAKKAGRVAQVVASVTSNVAKDEVFSRLFAALEHRTLSLRDLEELLYAFADDPAAAGVPADVIILDSGHWIPREDIVREGMCRCERNYCVGLNEKAHCYFQRSLSSWVVASHSCPN